MTGEPKSGMPCAEFDALLTEALDGLLAGERLAKFETHKQECAACAVLFQESRNGFDWLHGLEEVEPPANLVHNILAATSAVETKQTAAARETRSLWIRVKEAVAPRVAPMMSPRFAMSFGMAFFSLSMLMSVAGIRVTDIKQVDLSPKGIRKMYYTTEARAVRYYENIRLVYEIESRVRQLKRAATTPEEKKVEEPKPSDRGQGPERREQNYSRHEHDEVLALVARARQVDCA